MVSLCSPELDSASVCIQAGQELIMILLPQLYQRWEHRYESALTIKKKKKLDRNWFGLW